MKTPLQNRLPLGILVVLLLFGGVGCKPAAQQVEAPSAVRKPNELETFFVEWLEQHGEKSVVVDLRGVGLAGNGTRLKASSYAVNHLKNGKWSVEMEFRVALPSGGEIVEYVAGIGDDETQARKDSMANFVMTTFHVIYKSFMNAEDPHQTIKTVSIDGKTREMVQGDLYVRGEKDVEALELNTFAERIREAMAQQHLNARPHWIKVVYSQMRGKPMTVAVTRDNQDDAALTAAVTGLAWPSREEFYMAKQFIVIK